VTADKESQGKWPSPGFEVRAVDENDYEVPRGQMGELIVRTTEVNIAQQDLAWAVLGRAFGRIEQQLDRITDEARTAIAVVTQPCTPPTAGGTP